MLLALLDASHVHHARAKEWMLAQAEPKWASCPLTQNGFVRIISQPSYPAPATVRQGASLLAHAASSTLHEFWPDDLSLLDESAFDYSMIHGPKQISDAYLLALACRRGGRLVALDRAISVQAVRAAKSENLVIV
jgi:toxin-antitoxin system PIN domain toxin